ncbi:NUDIX hydrolase [Fictibacillus nanhaiensis]|uniref:NUDIX hydrolase n=1 Tax=Fictibacillus nanhaiensis TaxID=742169 RepID=A0ABS2ZS66_9BACL|nr:NUDIX hydrolase [Fictibacillus nanhaiensis]
MDSENLKIFSKDGKRLGVASRVEVHKNGYWHEAFHCWFISKMNDINYIDLQLRSKTKKENPYLLDITAAGHLLSHETISDGIREIKEEIGVDVTFDELLPLGVINYCTVKEEYIDNEFAHVFLYKSNYTLDDYILQQEEVSGIVRIKFDDFHDLWLGDKKEIRISGFEIDEGSKNIINQTASKDKFVKHPAPYYESVIKSIQSILNNENTTLQE